MASDHKSYTSDYLSSTESVLYAGKSLRSKLGSDSATIEYAITSLEKASKLQQGGGNQYRAFMFSELEGVPEGEIEKRERMSEDVLASVLAEVQSANVLIAAGRVVGETGQKAPPIDLDKAILGLDNTIMSLKKPISASLETQVQAGRFGFSESVTIQEVKSADVPSAKENVKKQADETLSTMVIETQSAASKIFTALSKLDFSKVSEALNKIGIGMESLSKVGRLIQAGIDKLKGAVDNIIKLLGSDSLQKVKDDVEKLWQNFKGGKYTEKILAAIFQTEDTKNKVNNVLKNESLSIEALDTASKELIQLTTKFKDAMSITQQIISAIVLAGGALTLVFGGIAALPVAIAYFVILAAVILTGMDYADAGFNLNRVRGIREITQKIVG